MSQARSARSADCTTPIRGLRISERPNIRVAGVFRARDVVSVLFDFTRPEAPLGSVWRSWHGQTKKPKEGNMCPSSGVHGAPVASAPMKTLSPLLHALVAVALTATSFAQSTEKLRPEYIPSWSDAPATRVIELDFDASLTDDQNGARFKTAVLGLVAGDHLSVSSGRWSVNSFFFAHLRGTASAPIRITGEPGTVITRPNASQNIFNLGGNGSVPLTYVLLRGLEFTGGSYGVRVHAAEDLWIDQCHVHHTGELAIGANTHNTKRLFVTRCEIHHTGATGEGLYIGANNGVIVAEGAVVAMNHIHHTLQANFGSGVHLKQGSFGCLIAENTIHDTHFPGILCYGTGGRAVNRIENNTVWNCDTNPFQVQGEAVVRGNLVFARNASALQTGPHQGSTTRLSIVGNTFISQNGRGATISGWAGKPDMVLRNNAFYSRNDSAVFVSGGLAGVDVRDNLVFGPVQGTNPSAGFFLGGGLSDMIAVNWDASMRNARPLPGGALHLAGTPAPRVGVFARTGAVRSAPPSVGAMETGTYGRYVGPIVPGAPRLRLRAPVAQVGGPDAVVEVLGLLPGDRVEFSVTYQPSGAFMGARALPHHSVHRRTGVADAAGRLRFLVPPSEFSSPFSDEVALRARVIRGPFSAWSRTMLVRP